MLNIFKKQKNNTILKLYRVVTPDDAKSFNTARLIEFALANLFVTEPTNYAITGPYPNDGWITKKGFLKAVTSKGYQDICHLMISNENIHFSFENWLLNEMKPDGIGYQAIEFFAPEDICDSRKMEKFSADFCDFFSIDYGFIFSLPMNYDPFSEQKIKKGFFGESITINAKDRLWTQGIQQIKNGLLKNIYPINFINTTVFESEDFQTKICENKIGSITNLSDDLKKWVLNQDEIEKAKLALKNSGLLFQ